MIRPQLALLLIVTVVSSAGAQAKPLDPGRLLGCYSFTWGRGSNMRPSFPDTVRLTRDSTSSLFRGVYRARTSSSWEQKAPPSEYIWGVGGDTITISKTDGYVGTSLRLRVVGEGLVGRGSQWTDVIDAKHPPPEWPVTGHRVECPKDL